MHWEMWSWWDRLRFQLAEANKILNSLWSVVLKHRVSQQQQQQQLNAGHAGTLASLEPTYRKQIRYPFLPCFLEKSPYSSVRFESLAKVAFVATQASNMYLAEMTFIFQHGQYANKPCRRKRETVKESSD